jgi:hypothetical protein
MQNYRGLFASAAGLTLFAANVAGAQPAPQIKAPTLPQPIGHNTTVVDGSIPAVMANKATSCDHFYTKLTLASGASVYSKMSALETKGGVSSSNTSWCYFKIVAGLKETSSGTVYWKSATTNWVVLRTLTLEPGHYIKLNQINNRYYLKQP